MQASVIILGVLGASVLALGYALFRLNRRLANALGGSSAKNIESSLSNFFGRIKNLEQQQSVTASELERLGNQIDLASQKISIVRFNPFGETSGDQSFSLAVLDAKKSGYVLTSIHSRESTRTYIKPIDLGVSKYTLSKEEKQAIDQASKRVPLRKTKPGNNRG